jgi:predicted nucleic acid-binding protein
VRVFLDTNVWASAFGSRGICQDMVALLLADPERRGFRLLSCEQVKDEILRALRFKFRVSEQGFTAAIRVLEAIESLKHFACPPVPSDFPDPDDWPILCAAVAANADLFVTGDKALLDLEKFEGLPIIDPRSAYMRLRGLS